MTLTPTHPEDPRRHIESRLVDVLSGAPLMQRPERRQLMLQLLRERLDHQITFQEHAEPRYQCVEIVHICLRTRSALRAVVEVVEILEPHAEQVRQLRQLTDEWERLQHQEQLRAHEQEVVDILPGEDWSQLRAKLEGIRFGHLGRLYQRATGYQLASPPSWCVNAWDMYIHLAGQNAPPTGLPPSMVFLLLLEQEVDNDVAELIRHRNQRQATAHGLTTEFDRRRAAMNAGSDQPPNPFAYLVIQVEPDLEPTPQPGPEPRAGGEQERYTVAHYRQWHGEESWHSRLVGHIRGVRYADLESTVEMVIRQMEIDWSDRRETVVIEFVLPLELLNTDVCWWRKETEPDAWLPPTVLAMDYPVVLRSLDRLREPQWHRSWRQRWELMQAEPARSHVHRSQPDGADYFTRLEADLRSDPCCTSLVLSEPPTTTTDTGMREMLAALRSGLPVVIWHRAARTTTAFWEEIHEMTADGRITGLPIHARKARLDALRLEPELRSNHIGRHLTVLWDDPGRTPELDARDR